MGPLVVNCKRKPGGGRNLEAEAQSVDVDRRPLKLVEIEEALQHIVRSTLKRILSGPFFFICERVRCSSRLC